jgi:hypothetical protein
MSDEAAVLSTLVRRLDALIARLEAAMADDDRAAWLEAERMYDTDFSRGLEDSIPVPTPIGKPGWGKKPVRDPYVKAVAQVRRRSDTIGRLLEFQAARDASRSAPSPPDVAPSAPPSTSASLSSTQRSDRPSRRWSLLALVAAALLVLTWVAPLTWWATLVFAALFLVLAVTTALVYWPDVSATPAIVTLLCAIAFFGIVYASIQLASSDDPLGVSDDPRLGEAFLIATSMGIAGGLISGKLDVGPKVVAHAQLLLLLTVLATALAEAFRSLRPRDRELE